MKKRLEGAKGNWAKELPNVLWAYRTTLKRLVGETPFSIMYGATAMIPIKISFLSMRVDNYDQGDNDTRLVGMLDSLEEK